MKACLNAKKLRCFVVFKLYFENIAKIISISFRETIVRVTMFHFGDILTLPICKVFFIYSNGATSSICRQILNLKHLYLEREYKKQPSASVNPLNHSIKSSDKVSCCPLGNSIVVNSGSSLPLIKPTLVWNLELTFAPEIEEYNLKFNNRASSLSEGFGDAKERGNDGTNKG